MKLTDLEHIHNLLNKRKRLVRVLDRISSTSWLKVSVESNESYILSMNNLFFRDGPMMDQVKEIMTIECKEQIALVDEEISKYGIEVDQ